MNYGAARPSPSPPTADYHVADVLVDGASVGARDQLHLHQRHRQPHHCRELRHRHPHHHGLRPGPTASISPSGAVTVNYGGSQTFTITPGGQLPRGRRPGGRRLRGGGDQLYLHQRHRQPHHCRQLRHRHPHHHGLRPGPTAAISPAGAVTVNYGATRPSPSPPAPTTTWPTSWWTASPWGRSTSYTFTNVTANHTIAASFAIDTYTITASGRGQRLHLALRRRSR